MRSVKAAVYGPDGSTVVDRYLEMEKRRSINLDSLARLGCEMRVATLDLPKTGKGAETSRFLRIIRSVERQIAGVGRRRALGRQDVAPREASVSVTRGDGGRTGDKELVLELVFCEI